METSEDFTIPCAGSGVSSFEFETCLTEQDVPTPVKVPTLVNPPSPNNTRFSLGLYYYPSKLPNGDYAELMLLDPYGNVIPDFEDPVVFYWPYPEGHSQHSGHRYTMKHYLDNSHTKHEYLEVTPTEKGLRFVSDSFSPYELTWEEPVPATGDTASLWLWMSLLGISAAGVLLVLRRRKMA